MKGSAVRVRASASRSRKCLHNANSCCLSRRGERNTANLGVPRPSPRKSLQTGRFLAHGLRQQLPPGAMEEHPAGSERVQRRRAVSPRARVSGSSCGSRGRASGRPRKRQGRGRSSTARTPTPSSRRFESGRADPPSARSKLQPSSQRSNERSSNYDSRRVECQAASQSPILGERMIGTPCVGTR